jgi:hypothetical protein
MIAVDYFGLRFEPLQHPESGIEVIEDHTHDPWSPWAYASNADYCIASLRKTLPVPDGAVLWSPSGHALPEPLPITTARRIAAHDKLAAMVLKSAFLQGHPVLKQHFRNLSARGERRIAATRPSGMSEFSTSIIQTLPIDDWRERRRCNHQRLSNDLNHFNNLEILPPRDNRTVPFSAVLHCDSNALREHLRRGLIARNVYPAVPWPLEELVLEGIPDSDRDLSRRLLSIHCDLRYTPSDMDTVAQIVEEIHLRSTG